MKKTKEPSIHVKEQVRSFVVNWVNKHPIDFIWRKKYNIPFGSPEHTCMTFLDMLVDITEDRVMRQNAKNDTGFNPKEDTMLNSFVGKNDLTDVKKQILKLTKKEIDQEFSVLDLDKFNDPK